MRSLNPVDVVIPVHNAPELTRRCIDSVFTHLGKSIRRVWIQDDASGVETREMLGSLPYDRVHVHHAQQNQGFGFSVNEAIARSDAPLVLVLNSDTEVVEDFLPRLLGTFQADPRLAAINPAGTPFARYDFARYRRQPGGYVRTHRLMGYAFLIGRDAFVVAGGFDPIFGRGYFEDFDLARRLERRGWRLGVHPDTHLIHEEGGSFGRGVAIRDLIRRNYELYCERNPLARRSLMLLSDGRPIGAFSERLASAVEEVLQGGGRVHWLTPDPVPLLPCLEISSRPAGVRAAIKLMRKGRRRRNKYVKFVWREKRISDVWILPGAPRLLTGLLVAWSRRRRLTVERWDGRLG